MSDSESDYGWGKKDANVDITSPYRPENKRLHSNDSISDEPSPKKVKTKTNIPTQPPMMLFKHFLNQLEDDLNVDEAMKKYNEYKEKFATDQLRAFFDAHRDEEWFKEKYHPEFIESSESTKLQYIKDRKKAYDHLKENGWLDNLSIHVNFQDDIIKLMDTLCIYLEGGNENDLQSLDRKIYRPDSPIRNEIKIDILKDESVSNVISRDMFNEEDIEINEENKTELKESPKKTEAVPLVEVNDSVVISEDEKPKIGEPQSLHKNKSIFIPNLPANSFRSQLEEIFKQFPGYLRMAFQDPVPERDFMRRVWVTFSCHTDMASVLWQLKKHKFEESDLGAVINKEEFQRIRPVSALVNHRAVMRQDVKYAAKLVGKFDKKYNLWKDGEINPLLKNITEYLVDEGNYEEEAYLGGNINTNLALTGGGDPNNITIDEDKDLAKVLDKMIFYLRLVHSYDYYSSTDYVVEDNLPIKVGLLHVRGNPLYPSQTFKLEEIEEYMKLTETRAQFVLDTIEKLDFETAAKLGAKTVEQALDKFILDNTKEITSDKWLCPLSGKKFKGPEFVRKHIYNKYPDRIEHVKETVDYLNNYIRDARRPQLQEHPNNRPNKIVSLINSAQNKQRQPIQYSPNKFGRRGDNDWNQSGYQRRNFNENRNYRDEVRVKSAYSRKILNYNDVEN